MRRSIPLELSPFLLLSLEFTANPSRHPRAKAIWDFEGIFCSSRHIPHLRFPGLIHPGILGCAPSAEILAEWNRREAELISTTKLERIVALPPQPQNVHAGSASGELKEKVGKEGARTVPGRPEHGGNCDIKNLSRGSKVFLPVHVPGAKFSIGDLHFSQGDGEISFCGAIEMAGVVTLSFTVMKGGMKDLDMKSPLFLPGPVEPHYGPSRYLTFEGFSVDEKGVQHYMDATVAYRQATLRCIEYLRRYGKLKSRGEGRCEDCMLIFYRLQRLSGLLDVELCTNSGTCWRISRYPQCMYDTRSANGYLRLRHFARWWDPKEARDGCLCCGEQVDLLSMAAGIGGCRMALKMVRRGSVSYVESW